MMSKKSPLPKFAFFLSLLCTLSANAQTTYLCMATKSTGFVFDGRSWVNTNFNVEKERMLLKVSPNSSEWMRVGEKSGMKCGALTETGRLNCDLIFGDLIFDKNTLRYLESYLPGYIDGRDEKGNTPSITIGKCSPL